MEGVEMSAPLEDMGMVSSVSFSSLVFAYRVALFRTSITNNLIHYSPSGLTTQPPGHPVTCPHSRVQLRSSKELPILMEMLQQVLQWTWVLVLSGPFGEQEFLHHQWLRYVKNLYLLHVYLTSLSCSRPTLPPTSPHPHPHPHPQLHRSHH